MTKLNLQIAHQVPGRIRMKIPSAKGNPELLEEMTRSFIASKFDLKLLIWAIVLSDAYQRDSIAPSVR